MGHSFVVYLDESGDEGFKFSAGSSEWFVLSAVITRKETDLETVKLIDRVRTLLKRNDQNPLHFRDIKHEMRLPYVHEISKARLRAITVAMHKPSFNSPQTFQERNVLYFYISRFLLERVSWFCRDQKRSADTGDGSAEIVFSNRGGLKLQEFCDYLDRLKDESSTNTTINIDWETMKSSQIQVESVKKMGLQIADAVASSFYFAVNPRYGFTEDRYMRMLKPVIYHRQGKYKSYGIKIFPEMNGSISASNLEWLKTYFGF